MAGHIVRFENLTSPEIDALDRQKTIFLVPFSPLEGHGAHLPVGVDYFNAVYFAEKIAPMILERRPEFDIVIYPGIPLGTQVYRQPGSIRVGSPTIYNITAGLGQSLAIWGFRYIFWLSGHGAPKQIVAMESACLKISRKYKIQAHSLSGALAIRFLRGEFVEKISAQLKEPLGEQAQELLRSDIHGGWWETSMMLLLRPELVKDTYKTLPHVHRDKFTQSPATGYFGSPSMASAEFAEASLNVMSREALQIIEACLDGRDIFSQTVSPLYRIYFLRPYFVLAAILIIVLLVIITLLILFYNRFL